VVDITHDRLFELVDAKAGLGLKEALGHVPGRDRLARVVLDLAEHYRSFAKSFFPNARLVADQFHVIRLFNRLLNKKRIEKTGIVRNLPIRTLTLRNREDLDVDERRELWRWLEQHADVKELYQYKESIRTFYRTRVPRLARRLFIELADRMARSRQTAVRALRETLLSWRSEILAFHERRLTNAMAEGFNRKAKLVQRRAFGYRSFRNYRLRLLHACA
jgi:transposase